MLTILFVFILVHSSEAHVGAIARLRDFALPLRSECSAQDEQDANSISSRPADRVKEMELP
jgi:hypothetical protein